MTRTGPSAADAALIAELKRKGLGVSVAQLERWRTIGAVPRNCRTYLGRGRGSCSDPGNDVAELAEAMALVGRRGRSVHEAVLRIFTVDPRNLDLFEPCLRIPEKGIRSSFEWFVRHGDQSVDRRVERALKRANNQEDKAEIISRVASRHFRNAYLHPPPTAKYAPPIWQVANEQSIQNLAALTIGSFLGHEEVGAQKLAEIMADAAPSSATQEEREAFRASVETVLAAHELAGREALQPSTPPSMEETICRLEETEIKRIHDTRNRIAIVAQIGYIYLHVRGSAGFEDLTERTLEASTESFDANMLLYACAPIAETLETSAWHRMSALIINILMDADLHDTLEKLTAAIIPEKLKYRFAE
ncbi:hypothetical protein ACFY0F_00735 [Streptomyces sp. NPDC001544]|uniref:hypothetical protein n=1 Tax=Streptomyces sp. NPDC001544 TaxID=3364584 RepID=UPI003683392B